MKFFENKKLAAQLSVTSNTLLIVLKLIAGVITGSISIISEAIHSCSDLLASIITLFSVHKSEKPADTDHQFGHGKYEDFSGLIEGLLIIFAAAYILYEVFRKLTGISEPISNNLIAIWVMLASVLVNICVSVYLMKVAKHTDSIALYADAEHLNTDIYSSLTVFLGLLCIHYTGLHIIDPILAVIVSVIIVHTGYKICKESVNNLLDGSLPENNIQKIKEILKKYNTHGIRAIKEIKTRKAGKNKEINITLLLDGEKTIKFAHDLCDILEKEIENDLGNTEVIIHVEPVETAVTTSTAE